MYQNIKDEMKRRLQNSKLMQSFRNNQSKLYQPSAIGQGINSDIIGTTPDIGSNAVSDAINTNVMNGATQGATQALGNAVSKAAPVVGAAFGAKNAVDSFSNGDAVGGALNLAKMAGVVPGVGTAIAGVASIADMVRGAMNNKKQQAMQLSQEENAKAQQQAQQDYAQQKAGIDELQMENAQNMQQQMDKQNQDSIEGQITGRAAPMPVLQASQPIDENATPLPYEGSAQQAIAERDAQKLSIMDKLRNGFSDFAAGYQDNANTDFAHGDLMNGITTGGAAPVQTSPDTFSLGAEQNKKSIMARLGELAGTGQRIMAHPLTQAAIAGGISRMAGGDIDDVAKAAFQYGSQKAAADRYYQQVTGNTNRPFLNSYNAQDVTNKRLEDAMAQRQQQWMYEQMIKQAQQNWSNQFNQEKFDYQKDLDKQKLDLQKEVHNARLQGKGGYGRYQGRPQPFDPTTVPGFYDDYEALEALNNVDENSDEYREDLSKTLQLLYEAPDGWFGHYTDDQINKAKAYMEKAKQNKQNEFNRKYRINPMKGKKY